jgi:hypothetical protein
MLDVFFRISDCNFENKYDLEIRCNEIDNGQWKTLGLITKATWKSHEEEIKQAVRVGIELGRKYPKKWTP